MKGTNHYTGIIHLHSAYSHDGHDSVAEMAHSLKGQGIDFCVLSDHFEDFDSKKFEEYLADVKSANALGQTVMVPAVEVEFGPCHVLMLPAQSYDIVKQAVERRKLPGAEVAKFLAHPAKYPFDELTSFMRDNELDGLEVWNQQADGNYEPPVRCLRKLTEVLFQTPRAVFFGCDVHNVKHRLNNLLLIERDAALTPEWIVQKLKQGEFSNYNRNCSSSLPGNAGVDGIESWLNDLERRRSLKARVVRTLHRCLKRVYHLLPRTAQPALNDFKNALKNRL